MEMVKKPEQYGLDVTMEEVRQDQTKGTNIEVLERAINIISDTSNQHKRGSQTVDVCFNLEIVRLMLDSVKKSLH